MLGSPFMSAPAPAESRPSFTEGFRALRHRDFRLYFGGQFVSLIGTWMQAVAQGWLMHRLTSSPMMLGLLAFVQFIPVLPLALHAGVIADRIPRRRLLLWTQSLQLLQAVLMALVVVTNVVQPWMVLALALMYGVVNTFDLPARQSFVIDLTGKDDLPNGIALNSAAFNAARILGPAVAGILVASVGEAGCFAFNALSFVAVLVSLLLMRPTPPAATTEPRASVADTLRDGLRYAWATPTIRQLLVLLAICSGFGYQYTVLLPIYAREVLHAGAHEYGWLFSAFGAGSLIAALRMAVTRDRWALRRHLLVGLCAAAAGFLGFAWVHTLPAMIGFAALAGFGLILYVASTNTLIQLTVEDRYRGRVMSLYTLFFVGPAPFGALLAGFIAQHLGAPAATTVCSLVLLGGALWVSVRLREIAAREAAAAPSPLG
jgi:MFS family permease